jgi:serine/threonine protein kinase
MDSWNPKANDVFLQALDLRSPRERSAYLDEACGANAELRAEVELLLSASERAGSFLEEPATSAPPIGELSSDNQPTSDPPPIEGPGTRVGAYKLLQQIGEGGMGIVYMAEQLEPVRRKVALKIIKPGMDSAQVIARFEAERQALAMMDHTNIAKVFWTITWMW